MICVVFVCLEDFVERNLEIPELFVANTIFFISLTLVSHGMHSTIIILLMRVAFLGVLVCCLE